MRIKNDNDLYAVPKTDRYYTQGLRVDWTLSERDTRDTFSGALGLLPLFGDIEHPSATASVGQQIFTPEDLARRGPNPVDRPYAGWLFGGLRLYNSIAGNGPSRADRLESWELDLGIVGPSSLASRAQRAAHRLYAGTPPAGWTNQLHDEPGLELRYQRSHRLAFAQRGWPLPWPTDVLGDVGFSLGNVLTAARGGIRLRFGGLRRDFRTDDVAPPANILDQGSDPPRLPFYGFLGAQARAVLHNNFLDGNTYRHSLSVDKEPLLVEFSAGVVVPLESTELGLSMTVTSPEFETTSSWQRFGSIWIETRF